MSAPDTPAPYAPQPQGAPEVTTRRGLLDRLTARLTGLYDAREARSIALIALAELAGLPLSALLTDPGAPMAADGFEAMAAQLAAGRPVQYVVGHTEFYGHRFAVREGVLIPRPETEELVSWVVHDERRARALLDVGTGSGCIAASLALALPGAEVCAADLSDAALAIAAENFRTLGARVTLRKADALGGLDEAFPGPFDAIVSNPPYVPQSDLAAMHANVREYEPREALFVPDDDALQFYRAIARAGRRMLRPGGKLYFEIYERSAGQMRLLLGEEGYTDTEVREDLKADEGEVVAVADDFAAEEPSVTPVAAHTPVPSEPVAAEVPAETAGERATEPAPAGPAPEDDGPVVENAGAEPAAEVAGADTEAGAQTGSETSALEAMASDASVADGPAAPRRRKAVVKIVEEADGETPAAETADGVAPARRPARRPRRGKKEDAENKELFAFYEQSLF